jgi:hypothetical protein
MEEDTDGSYYCDEGVVLLKVGVSLECESFIVEGHEEAEGCDA